MSAIVPHRHTVTLKRRLAQAFQSDWSVLYCLLIGIMILGAAADAITTAIGLSRGAYETIPANAVMQQALGLPLWGVMWVGMYAAIAGVAVTCWYGSFWITRAYPLLRLPALAWRLLLFLVAFYCDLPILATVVHNIMVILQVPLP